MFYCLILFEVCHQQAVQEIILWHPYAAQDEEEYESNDDFDSEGQSILDFEEDAEYEGSEPPEDIQYRPSPSPPRPS